MSCYLQGFYSEPLWIHETTDTGDAFGPCDAREAAFSSPPEGLLNFRALHASVHGICGPLNDNLGQDLQTQTQEPQAALSKPLSGPQPASGPLQAFGSFG